MEASFLTFFTPKPLSLTKAFSKQIETELRMNLIYSSIQSGGLFHSPSIHLSNQEGWSIPHLFNQEDWSIPHLSTWEGWPILIYPATRHLYLPIAFYPLITVFHLCNLEGK